MIFHTNEPAANNKSSRMDVEPYICNPKWLFSLFQFHTHVSITLNSQFEFCEDPKKLKWSILN